MKKEPVFLGLYSRQKSNDTGGNETRWNVWELDGGMFLAQQTEDSMDAPGERETVDSHTFFNEFRIHAVFGANATVAASDNIKDTAAAKEEDPVMAEPEKAAPANTGNALKPGETERAASYADPVIEAEAEMFENLSPSGLQASMELLVDEIDDLDSPFVAAAMQETPAFAAEPEEPKKNSKTAKTFFVDKSGNSSSSGNIMDSALAKIEEQLRSEFSIALIRLRTDREQAIQSLDKIIEYKAPFREEHKHMFSEFGTALRRRQLYAMASRFHERAMHLAPDDEHILFNLARALYDAGKIDKARQYLREAVAMSNDFQAGSDFLEFIEGRSSGI